MRIYQNTSTTRGASVWMKPTCLRCVLVNSYSLLALTRVLISRTLLEYPIETNRPGTSCLIREQGNLLYP